MRVNSIERPSSHPLRREEGDDDDDDEGGGGATTCPNRVPCHVDTQRFCDKEYPRFIAAYKDKRTALKRLHSIASYRTERAPPSYPLSYEKFCLIKELYRHRFVRSSHPKHQDTCVLIDNVGSFNESLRAFRKHGITDDDIIEHAVFLISYFTSIIDSRPYPHGRIVRVFDLSGFRLSHAINLRAMRLGLRLTMTAERYFPEVLQDVIVLNAHPVAIGVYNRLIRGLLHERTRSKFQFHTDNGVLQEILGSEQVNWQHVDSPVETAMYDYVWRQGQV